MTPAGFPHSDIPGSKTVCVSPRLIAAYHVLHRLLVPRHPPCTLSSLTGSSKVLHCVYPASRIRLSMSVSGALSTTAPLSGANISIGAAMRHPLESGGDSGARTRSLRLAKPALSQLSYIPNMFIRRAWPRAKVVGLSGLEPPTSRLSGVRSNQLSYRPTRTASWRSSLPRCVSTWSSLAREPPARQLYIRSRRDVAAERIEPQNERRIAHGLESPEVRPG